MAETPTGIPALRAALEAMPTMPGCYQMLDAAGKILYVGKAKNLRNRVTSYTNITNLNNRILRMVNQIARVEITPAKNEAEALLIEASLIKKHQPRYNVLLKDDKSFPYIRIDTSHAFPRIEKHRGSQNKPGEYFGPFANVMALNQAMALLQKIFLLRPCADSIFANRSRPCLQYQIKRCSAPCVGYVTPAHYGEQLSKARAFFKGKSREVQEALSAEMNAASMAMDYEKAGQLRDRIRALTTVQQEQGLRVAGLEDADVIALARRGDKSVVTVFFYRSGAPFGSQNFHPRHAADASDAEVLMGFLGQFYQAHVPPGEILIGEPGIEISENREVECGGEAGSVDTSRSESLPPEGGVGGGLSWSTKSAPTQPSPSGGGLLALTRSLHGELTLLAEALSQRAERKVEIRIPERGDKKALVERAQQHAQSALARLEMERASVESHLLKLKELFDLPRMPQRIEVYDNSHISGTHAVGAMIVATPEGFDKKSYRTFTIKDATPGDDYGMMREVFKRRFKNTSLTESLRLSHESEAGSEGYIAQRTSPPGGGSRRGAGIGQDLASNQPPPQPSPSGGGLSALRASLRDDGDASIPDLLLIDGGIGQLHAVEEALKNLQVEGPALVAIAKGEDRNAGREWFHLPDRAPFQLPVNDPALHYLQRLRDEAHRFAIGRHRNKRSKSFTASALDDIPGIGPTRKRALLQHFGSRADVETATREELQKVPGINKATAQAIYDYFHG